MKNWITRKWASFKAWCGRQYRKVTAFVVALLMSLGLLVTAQDQSVTITWVNATEYTTGEPLPIEEIRETKVWRASYPLGTTPDGSVAPVVVASVPPTVTVYVDNPGTGVFCYYATHVATNGHESAPSAEDCATRDERVPGSPLNVTVQ